MVTTRGTAKGIALAAGAASPFLFVAPLAASGPEVTPTYINAYSAYARAWMYSYDVWCLFHPEGFRVDAGAITYAEGDTDSDQAPCYYNTAGAIAEAGMAAGACAQAKVIGYGMGGSGTPTQIAYEAAGTACWSFG